MFLGFASSVCLVALLFLPDTKMVGETDVTISGMWYVGFGFGHFGLVLFLAIIWIHINKKTWLRTINHRGWQR